MNDLGQLRTVVSKSYIYNLIQNQTGFRSDAGPGLFYSALPKMGKAKVYDYQVFPLNGGKLIIVYYTSVFAENTSLL